MNELQRLIDELREKNQKHGCSAIDIATFCDRATEANERKSVLFPSNSSFEDGGYAAVGESNPSSNELE